MRLHLICSSALEAAGTGTSSRDEVPFLWQLCDSNSSDQLQLADDISVRFNLNCLRNQVAYGMEGWICICQPSSPLPFPNGLHSSKGVVDRKQWEYLMQGTLMALAQGTHGIRSSPDPFDRHVAVPAKTSFRRHSEHRKRRSIEVPGYGGVPCSVAFDLGSNPSSEEVCANVGSTDAGPACSWGEREGHGVGCWANEILCTVGLGEYPLDSGVDESTFCAGKADNLCRWDRELDTCIRSPQVGDCHLLLLQDECERIDRRCTWVS